MKESTANIRGEILSLLQRGESSGIRPTQVEMCHALGFKAVRAVQYHSKR